MHPKWSKPVLALAEAVQPHYTQEHHRHYHTWDHIETMLATLHQEAEEVTQAMVIATLFHDAVYIPGFEHNEAASAELMWTLAARALSPQMYATLRPDLTHAAAMILATKDHESDDPDTQWVIDADMAWLGDAYKAFDAKRELIRKEYVRYDDITFYSGEIAFIEHCLAQPRLFYHGCFDEVQARQNLERRKIRIEKRLLDFTKT
jgi:predicted metal-dependent HD superfamily phosphohydrolase